MNDPNLQAAYEIAEQVCGCNGRADIVGRIRFSWCDRLYRSIANCRRVDEGWEIHLSSRLFPSASFDECVETVVHEVCHALAESTGGSGHGETWKCCMERSGYANPVDYYVAGR